MISPGVEITESNNFIDISSDYPKAFFSGEFEKGIINKPMMVRTLSEFKHIFGRATNQNYNDWYQVYNYMSYGNSIYVNRVSGDERYNSQSPYFHSGDPYVPETIDDITIEDYDDFKIKYDSIPTYSLSPITFIARTPGAWGNLLEISMISNKELEDNVILYGDVRGQSVFTELNEDEYGIVIIRNGIIVEKFIKLEENIEELNEESNYVFVKTEINWNVYSVIDGNILLFDGNGVTIEEDGIYDGNITYRYKINPIFYGSSRLYLSQGYSESPNENQVYSGYMEFKDDYELDIIIGNERNNQACIDVCDYRKDCIGFIGIPNLKYNKIIEYSKTLSNSEYVVLVGAYKKQFDRFVDKNRWVNIAGDIAGLRAQVNKSGHWLVSAGTKNRIINIVSLSFRCTKSMRDELYRNSINYVDVVNNITYLASEKTFLNYQSNFNKCHIRGLFNIIERNIRKISNNFVFDSNTYHTRKRITSNIRMYLNDVKAGKGMEYFKIVCDDTNNFSEMELVVDIYIKPLYVAEFIKIQVYNSGNTLTISEFRQTNS